MKQRDNGPRLFAVMSRLIQLFKRAMGFVRQVRPIHLIWRFAKVVVVVTVILALITGIPEGAASWYLFYLSPVILAGVVALPVYLWRSGRFSTFLLIVLAIVALSLAQFALMTRDAERAAQLDQRRFLPASTRHEFVVSAWGYGKCFELCMEILTRTNYRPVSEVRSAKEWIIFDRVEGPECTQGDNRRSFLAFLTAGFADTCAESSTQKIGDTALVVKIFYSRDRGGPSESMPEGLPRSFRGDVYELYERRLGSERLLGRWVRGHVRPLSYWFGLVGLSGWRVGDDFQAHHFYSAALQAQLIGGRFPGNSDLDRVLNQLESLVADPQLENKALNALRTLAEWKGKDLQASIESRAARLLDSSEPGRILAGFKLLSAFWKIDPAPVEAGIIKLVDHSDPRIVAAALAAAFKLPDQVRTGLNGKLVALADSPVLASADSPVLGPLLGHLHSFGGLAEADRMRAKKELIDNGNLSRAQRTALLAVLAHGGQPMRNEAGETIQLMSDPALFDIVLAVANVGWPSISGERRDGWTDQEMAVLVARADQVRPEQLQQYICALRSQESFDGYTGEIAKIVRARLAEARSATPPDAELIKTLQRLLSGL